MNKTIRVAIAIAGMALMCGCTNCKIGYRYQVAVDALAAPDAVPKEKRYYIASAIKDIGEDDLQFREFAGYIENALAARGATRVNTEKEADLLVRLSYGVGQPQITTQTYATSTGYAFPVGELWYFVPPKTQTTQTPTWTKQLQVEAYDLKSPKKSPVWKVTVSSNWGTEHIRSYFPYLVAAAMPYFGTKTNSEINIDVCCDDPKLDVVQPCSPGECGRWDGRVTGWRWQ